jgi:hypothetical protein
MGKPSYDDETLAAYFYPMSPALYDDPVVGSTLKRLAEEDPDIILAVADVDRSQCRDAMLEDPFERLGRAIDTMDALLGFRRVA